MVSYLVDENQYHSPPKNNPKNYSNNLVFKCMCDLISNFVIGTIIFEIYSISSKSMFVDFL